MLGCNVCGVAHKQVLRIATTLFEVKRPGAKYADQSNCDQVNCNDEVQKLGHQQDENACHKRD